MSTVELGSPQLMDQINGSLFEGPGIYIYIYRTCIPGERLLEPVSIGHERAPEIPHPESPNSFFSESDQMW